MSLEMIAFVLLSAGLLGTSSAVLIARNPIHSALYLTLSFFSLAGLYLLLNANFVAIIQVLVYAGAIMVLFLFVIMLLNMSDEELGESRLNLHKVLGSVGGLALVGLLVWAITGAQDRYLNDATFMRSSAVKQLESQVLWPREFSDWTWQGVSTDGELQIYKKLRAWRRLNEALDAHTGEGGERAMCALALPELTQRAKIQCANVGAGDRTCDVLRSISNAGKSGGCSEVLSAGLGGEMVQQAQQLLDSAELAEIPAMVSDLQIATTTHKGTDLSHLTQGGVADLYLALFELRTLSQEKLRFEHGQGTKQLEACTRLAAVISEIDVGRCAWVAEGAQYPVDACFELEKARPIAPLLCEQLSGAQARTAVKQLDLLCAQASAFGGMAAERCAQLSAIDQTNPANKAGYVATCADVVQAVNALELPRCSALRGDFVADVVAQTDAASAGFDAKLAQVEAMMDASPVPSEWRGFASYRRPALQMSRYELAVADAIGVFFAQRLNHVIDHSILDPERKARVEALVQIDAGMQEGGKVAQAGVFERARHRFEAVIESQAVQGDEADKLTAWFEEDQREYRALLNRAIVALRDKKPGDVIAIIQDLEQSKQAQEMPLDANAKAHVASVLAGLASPQGGRNVLNKPAVYDEDEFGSVRAVGRDMFTNLLLPFEVTSVLLLAAIMGAVVIAKRRS
jgi:NADH-quinone oxidoreductase subunit J